MSESPLSPEQRAAAAKVLGEEGARRRHLVVALSGAHAYGFPSPDSDVDVKAIHAAATAELLGFHPLAPAADRLEVVDGVEIDYTSNEIGAALSGMLRGNGNYLERVLAPNALSASPELEGLQAVARSSLSRRILGHYRGFASGQLREWERGGFTSAKKLLYVLRTCLTGARALRTGEMVTDLNALLEDDGFGAARELIEAKRRGERAELPRDLAERWKPEVARAFAVLEGAAGSSPLPETPSSEAEAEAWLIALRLAALGRA
jgi:predicted nucleotidyltransferase